MPFTRLVNDQSVPLPLLSLLQAPRPAPGANLETEGLAEVGTWNLIPLCRSAVRPHVRVPRERHLLDRGELSQTQRFIHHGFYLGFAVC